MFYRPMLDDLKIIFIPSTRDIAEYDGDNSYASGLSDVEEEVRQIIDSLSQAFFDAPKSEKASIPVLSLESKASRGYMPELLVQASLIIPASTLSAIFYNLISNWIAHRNGRRLRIRLPNGFEVEATQLNKEEFQRLFELLHSKYGESSGQEFMSSHLEEVGFTVASAEETQALEKELRKIYFEKRNEMSERDERKT